MVPITWVDGHREHFLQQSTSWTMHRDFKGIMRPGQNKRSRNRNMNGSHPNNNRPRPPHRIQTFDSSGPNVKIRGNAYQVFERYVALAREASSSGDRIAAENFYQHAEHYFRVMNANGGGGFGDQMQRPMTPADTEPTGPDTETEQPAAADSSPPSDPEVQPS